MKHLYLIRHATALSKDEQVPDFERPLIPKGIKESKKIAKRIGKNGQLNGVLITSPANRALETAHLFAKAWDYPVQKIVLKQELYDSSGGKELMNLVQSLDDSWETAVIFGHDPSLSELAQMLGKSFHELLPKAGAVGFKWRTDSWKSVTPKSGNLSLLEFPKREYAPDKLKKTARKELAAVLGDNISTILAEIDVKGSELIRKKIHKASRDLAESFLEKTGNKDIVLSYWLRSRKEVSDSADKTTESPDIEENVNQN